MIGMLVLYSALQAHTAVAMGALSTPGFSCIDKADAESREDLVDSAFARAIARHDLPDGTGSTEWHVRYAFAYIGSRIGFSAEERKAMVLPGLDDLPVCNRSQNAS